MGILYLQRTTQVVTRAECVKNTHNVNNHMRGSRGREREWAGVQPPPGISKVLLFISLHKSAKNRPTPLSNPLAPIRISGFV